MSNGQTLMTNEIAMLNDRGSNEPFPTRVPDSGRQAIGHLGLDLHWTLMFGHRTLSVFASQMV
jgi:hypothetical protein